MALAAYAALNTNVHAADDMDVHSDTGFDLDDGDIELDFDPAPPAPPHDGDVSITDAAMEGQPDALADQDDFMADNEELVDEDTILYDDEEPAHPTPPHNPAVTQVQTPAPEDEDLIDYSDDEEEPPAHQPTSMYQPVDAYQAEESDLGPQTHNAQAEEQVVVPTGGEMDALAQYENVNGQVTYEEDNAHLRKFEAEIEASDRTDGEDGGVRLQDFEHQTDTDENQNDDEQEQQSTTNRTVTVNYEGNELWLFKQYDTDDSGDWLIEDMSVLQGTLQELFQAIRASLGEDITNETELGLRFDHLHNMEIYEDNTACVAVPLDRMLDLYHTLHAQDGNNEPESFYMCLLSRPRFATLLSDVAKHAEQGSGYTGLNDAVSAGETHFVDASSGNSTEHEGGDGENGEEDYEGTESASNAEFEAETTEHEEQVHESGGDEEESPQEGNVSHADGSTSEETPEVEQAASHDEATQHHDADQSEVSAQQDQIDHDTIEYSDAEDDEEPPSRPLDAFSPSSATVQGDDTATGEPTTAPVDPAKPEEEDQHTGEVQNNHEAENADVQTHVAEQFGLEDNTEYQDFTGEYDQGDQFLDFQTGAAEGYAEEPNFESYTNDDYTGYGFPEVDQQLQNDLIGGTETDGIAVEDPMTATNEFTEGDDFLDLENAADWVPDEEALSKLPGDQVFSHDEFTVNEEEEEDGVAEQPAAAATSTTTTANPIATSSTDLQQTSPQGQKRSIDEVDDLADDAIIDTGTSWLSMSYKSAIKADLMAPDLKRPRK
jgi:hypothetical protein